MEKQFISEPMDFHYKEGNAVDFEKTFDLTGNDNDQMLKVYLRKAGLSDNIEYLTPEQRKAFIYDIVKSNKNPGYWKPSVLPPMSPAASHRIVSPPAESCAPETLSSIDDIPPASMSVDFNHYSQVSATINGRYTSVSTDQEQTVRGTLYERQFQQQKSISPKIYNAPPTPPSPSTILTRKGLKIEVSGPTNFQHISGDMTRDMTKNAFDLSGQFNGNSLKKYMIERGITEEDVSGMDTKELIKKIVQSKYTWMPIRKQYAGNYIPPPPSETYAAPLPNPPPRHKNHSKGGALIVNPPVLPSSANERNVNENIYLEIVPLEPCRTSVGKRPMKPPPPVPSPAVKHTNKGSPGNHIPPPPPLPAMTQTPVMPSLPPSMSSLNKPGGDSNPPPPPPPPIPALNLSGKGSSPPPPPPPMPTLNTSGSVPCPPPPPPPPALELPLSINAPKSDIPHKPLETGGDPRDAFLESIRAGVALKKVNKNNNPDGIKIPSHNQPQLSTPPGTVRQKTVKPEQPDFMSELRNATLKRIKKLENNPYADGSSESNC